MRHYLKRYYLFLFGLLLFMVGFTTSFFIFQSSILSTGDVNSTKPLVNETDLEQSLNESKKLLIDWFKNNQTEDGNFIYERGTVDNIIRSGYVTVRESLGLYSLTLAYKQNPDSALKHIIDKSISSFEKNTEEKSVLVDGKLLPGMIIKAKPEPHNSATALYLIALIHYVEAEPSLKEKYLPAIRAYSNYLLSTQKEEGDFYYQNYSGTDDYNTAEVLYALIRSYALLEDQKLLQGAERAAQFFIKNQNNDEFNSNTYSWNMRAFYHLYKTTKKYEYYLFMDKQSSLFFKNLGYYTEKYYDNSGPVIPGTEFSVYLEGFSHYISLLEDNSEVKNRYKKFYNKSLEYMFNYQINHSHSSRISPIKEVSGGMCLIEECYTIRIDSVAHMLSAILYKEALLQRN